MDHEQDLTLLHEITYLSTVHHKLKNEQVERELNTDSSFMGLEGPVTMFVSSDSGDSASKSSALEESVINCAHDEKSNLS